MTSGSGGAASAVIHGGFVILRELAASPEQVHAAWAEPGAKARWFCDGYDNAGQREQITRALRDQLAAEGAASARD